MKYKVGDKVVIRKDLKTGTQAYLAPNTRHQYVSESMESLAGQTRSISKITSYGFYHIEGSGNYWCDGDFENLAVSAAKKKNLFKAGDRVKIVKDLVTPDDPKDVGRYGVIESRRLLKDARSVNGVKLPYRIRFDNGTETDANAQELEAVDSHPQGTATAADCQAPVKSISTDEVIKIVTNEVALAQEKIMEDMKSNQFELMQQLTTVQTTIGILARELEEARRENADNQVNEDQ